MTDDDAPELTDAELAEFRPAREVMPPAFFDKVAELQKRPGQRGPGKKPPKRLVTLRIDSDVFDKLEGDGDNWRERVNDILRKALKLKKPAA